MPFLLTAVIWFSLLPAIRQQAASAAPPQGFWLSDGYGDLIHFDGNTLRAYELTAISCIATNTAKRPDNPGSGPPFVFRSGGAVATITPTSDSGTLRLHSDGAASDVILHRIPQMPDLCKQPPPNTPQENYAVFWQIFAEQYPFFALHKVDWRAVDKKMRPMVNSETKPAELFELFRQMIEPLHDAHTGVFAPESKSDFDGWRNDPNHLDDDAWKKAATIIETRYVHGGLQSYCRGQIQFGNVGHQIGYLRLTTFYGYGENDGYDSQLQCLDQSLDAIFGGPKLNGLVIDVRLNEGGDDPLGIEIASRLTQKKYLGYFKVARNNPNLDAPLHFTERQPCWVVPSTIRGFQGKTVLLIGPDTVSAGETFTMALQGREPHVRFIGLNTQGVFSDVLVRALPNGWKIRLPNEVYLTAGGKAFDATGVPPDVRVPFFSGADLQSGRDAALEEAINRLTH